MEQPKLIVTVQCDIVKERCSGYACVSAFNGRQHAFADYPPDAEIAMLPMSCGGCCGKRVLRKLSNVKKQVKKKGVKFPEEVLVHLSSCVALSSFHGPKCPNLDYMKECIGRHKLRIVEGSCVSGQSEKRRQEGVYK